MGGLRWASSAFFGSALTLAVGCTIVTSSDIGRGLGEPCSTNSDCQGQRCEQGDKRVCVAACTTDPDCPTGSRCAAGTCELPLKVGALYVGAKNEGWTLTHHEALERTQAERPYVEQLLLEEFVAPGSVSPRIDSLVAKGANVIFANSFSHAKEVADAAARYPNVEFLTCSGNIKNGKNLGSYFGRMEQAWYVAGNFAAQDGVTRIGYLGSFITPEVVRHLNAFTLGARKQNPNVVVEVRWLGFWFDYNAIIDQKKVDCKYGKDQKCTLEEWHTEMLLESGAQVIAHQMDNGLPVAYVEQWNKSAKPARPAKSIGNDNQYACRAENKPGGELFPSCMFSVYWNWKPTYERLLDEIHYKRWQHGLVNDNLSPDAKGSVAWIEVSPNGIRPALVDNMLQSLAGDAQVSKAFEGPYTTTGQREPVKPGERPKDAELNTMCYAVEGVVEKTNALDAKSPDKPALIPDDTHPAPAGVIPPQGAPMGVGNNCKQNGPPALQ